jgi:hypothetical protein
MHRVPLTRLIVIRINAFLTLSCIVFILLGIMAGVPLVRTAVDAEFDNDAIPDVFD